MALLYAMQADYLVIGGGLAGLSFALQVARDSTVIVLNKERLPESATAYAQGGIASVWSDDDSFDAHVADTERAGAGLCKRETVDLVVREGPARIRDLIAFGTEFSRGDDGGEYDLGMEGGHRHRRILHAADATGWEIMRALTEAVREQPNIQVLERHMAIDLITDRKLDPLARDSACWGAYVLDTEAGEVRTVAARATMLATGGAGKVYLYTSNPDIASGDGIAMAYRAGAPVANMEFIQFHPTCLFHPQAKSFLISEALRGEGAVLRRPDGEPFMSAYHPDAELAPRDVVARAIDNEMKVRGYEHVLLDITHQDADFLRRRFPTIHERCLSFGFDLTETPLPVVPAEHYCCGGVMTGLDGTTPIRRLYAAGEVSMTGLHGANRLASNSLLEAVVFGTRAAKHAQQSLADDRGKVPALPAWNPGQAVDSDESVVVTQNWDEIRRFMWNFVGIVRSNRRLARAYQRITALREEIHQYYWDFIVTGDLIELRNLATVAELTIASAIRRKESRGLHFNIDYPETAADAEDTVLRLSEPFYPDGEFLGSLASRRHPAPA